MDKNRIYLIVYVAIVTIANIYLWLAIVDGGAAPRAGRMMGLIIMLAVAAIFSDKFSSKPYAPELIKAGSLIAMTVLYFMLYNHDNLLN